MSEHPALTTVCDCGHIAIQHHGVDPRNGCLAVVSRHLIQCPCERTAQQLLEAAP